MREHEKFTLGQKALIVKDGRCLILELPRGGVWDLPGGRLEIGEDPEVAFRRELLEETGLVKVTVHEPIDFSIWRTPSSPSPVLLVGQRVEVQDSTSITLSDEHRSYQWVTLEELGGYLFVHDGMKRMVEVALQQERKK